MKAQTFLNRIAWLKLRITETFLSSPSSMFLMCPELITSNHVNSEFLVFCNSFSEKRELFLERKMHLQMLR